MEKSEEWVFVSYRTFNKDTQMKISVYWHSLKLLIFGLALPIVLISCQNIQTKKVSALSASSVEHSRSDDSAGTVTKITWGHTGLNAVPQKILEATPLTEENIRQKSEVRVLSPLIAKLKLSSCEKKVIHVYTQGPRRYAGSGFSFSNAPDDCYFRQPNKGNLKLPDFCEAMRSAYQHLPTSPGLVFRGISSVKVTEIKRLFASMEKREPVHLGEGKFKKWISSSRNLNIAKQIMYESDLNIYEDYKILYLINQKTGVSIENLSAFPEQQEVLLAPETLYKVDSMAPLLDSSHVTLVVSLTETQSPRDQQGSGFAFGSLCGCW